MRVTLLALLCVVAVAMAQQTICQKYGAVVGSQATLMQDVILDVFGRIAGDSLLLPWFTGAKNKGGKDFTVAGGNQTALVNHLIAFFGHALGCDSSEFTGSGAYNFGITTADMTATHAGFNSPITKAAYEAFNSHVIDSLHSFNVTNPDLLAVSQVLDGFRGLHPDKANQNQVCQASDCLTSPYSIHASDSSTNYFSPSYITVPQGVALQIVNNGAHPHTLTQGTFVVGGACTPTSGGFNSATISPGGTYTTPVFNKTGTINFFCNFHCPSAPVASQMVGQINVVSGTTGSSTGAAAGLSLAVAAAVAALLALLM